MSRHRKTVLYIAGPMTGLPDKNITAFNKAEEVLQLCGYATLNPARHEGQANDWKGYMRLGIQDVLTADGIALLPDWAKSKGALLETDIADNLGIPAEPVDYWINERA